MTSERSLALYEDALDMLADLVRQLGGPKNVGPIIRGPSVPVETAAQWVRDCLNRDRRERFDPEQFLLILRLAREEDIHSGKFWLDSELGYEQGKPLNAQDELATLQRNFSESVHTLRDQADRIERLLKSPLKAVAG